MSICLYSITYRKGTKKKPNHIDSLGPLFIQSPIPPQCSFFTIGSYLPTSNGRR
ncbi:hypothetical protein HYC85_016604 [Camellia sinensis]|uniref:Uncharacterized protein n=1 Tax=Camellia sinensis TaxID=4442 RepID=A0A7J7H3U8_CAMSI|nr:hypothetical protein HYC85_016604 [Camellia sinensis]